MKYTESIKDHEITDVMYTSKSKEDVLIAWTHKETKKISLDCISADLEHPDFQDVVSKIMTEEEIWINSVNKWRAEEQAQDERLFKIAKEKGYIHDLDDTDTFVGKILEYIYTEKNIKNEDLFKFKLKVFDHPKIQESKDKQLKAKLRKASSYKEVLETVLKF